MLLRFVLIMGIVNFFADVTYEGARSVSGPFLGTLGASATIVGVVAGLGELFSNSLRSIFGYFADRKRQYWLYAFIGYTINMVAVPTLALAGNWPIASALMICERTGKAIRKPVTETMLSFTTHKLGHGWVFGLNEALDQAGATIGPLIVAFVMYRHGSYQHAFAVLLIPALLCLITVIIAWFLYRHPQCFEQPSTAKQTTTFSKSFWFYVLGGCLMGAGTADFSLISFHFAQQNLISAEYIPIIYSLAMAVAAIASLVFGRLLDKKGFSMFITPLFLAAFFAPFAFSNHIILIILGSILWGIGLGSQDTLFKAELNKIIAHAKRATGFGTFDSIFGVAWFIGSATMGWLYDLSKPTLIIFSMILMLSALPIFYLAHKAKSSQK